LASITQTPGLRNVTVAPLKVHTDELDESMVSTTPSSALEVATGA
jgi:hypothetical protein